MGMGRLKKLKVGFYAALTLSSFVFINPLNKWHSIENEKIRYYKKIDINDELDLNSRIIEEVKKDALSKFNPEIKKKLENIIVIPLNLDKCIKNKGNDYCKYIEGLFTPIEIGKIKDGIISIRLDRTKDKMVKTLIHEYLHVIFDIYEQDSFRRDFISSINKCLINLDKIIFVGVESDIKPLFESLKKIMDDINAFNQILMALSLAYKKADKFINKNIDQAFASEIYAYFGSSGIFSYLQNFYTDFLNQDYIKENLIHFNCEVNKDNEKLKTK